MNYSVRNSELENRNVRGPDGFPEGLCMVRDCACAPTLILPHQKHRVGKQQLAIVPELPKQGVVD